MITNFLSRLTIICVFIVITSTSCKKWVQSAGNDDLTSEVVFMNDANAERAARGLYVKAMNSDLSFCNGGISLFAGLSADELIGTISYPYRDAFSKNALDGFNPYIFQLFDSAYNLIFIANTILEGVSASKGMSAGKKTQMIGEAKFMRAFLYFYLVNLWGGIPLVTTTDGQANSIIPRTEVKVIYDTIIADLIDAREKLPNSYIVPPGFDGERTRPNTASASAFLSRVYLYLGKWSDAASEATKVIGNPMYHLEPDLDRVFLSKSGEAIFQLQPVYQSLATAEGHMFNVHEGVPPSYVLTQELQNALENNDRRRAKWANTIVWNGNTYIYPYKYKLSSNNPAGKEYNMVLRLAEQFLIRAEAEANLNDLSGAINDLNKIRIRAGLASANPNTQTDLLEAIGHEWQVEFFAEWGHRWLDLKRNNKVNEVLGKEKPSWKPTAALYPFTNYDLMHNPFLVQNPGY